MNLFKIIIKYSLFLIVIFSCFHCGHLKGPECIKNNKKYGTIRGVFRGNCWNYYERGLSYAEGGCFEAAIDDFQKAIQCDRTDCKIDQYMAPTYGNYFVPYFPHREMGIVHYKKADYINAQKKLEKSLLDVDSDKARFYLDLVRKKNIENKKAKSIPKICFYNETAEIVSSSDYYMFSGCITDELFISEVILSGAVEKVIRYSWEGSEKKIEFNEKLRLPQGHHKLIIKATNLAGKTAEKEQTVIIDRLGPVFFLNTDDINKSSIEPNSKNQMNICGSLYDDFIVNSLMINKQKVDITPNTKVTFLQKNLH